MPILASSPEYVTDGVITARTGTIIPSYRVRQKGVAQLPCGIKGPSSLTIYFTVPHIESTNQIALETGTQVIHLSTTNNLYSLSIHVPYILDESSSVGKFSRKHQLLTLSLRVLDADPSHHLYPRALALSDPTQDPNNVAANPPVASVAAAPPTAVQKPSATITVTCDQAMAVPPEDLPPTTMGSGVRPPSSASATALGGTQGASSGGPTATTHPTASREVHINNEPALHTPLGGPSTSSPAVPRAEYSRPGPPAGLSGGPRPPPHAIPKVSSTGSLGGSGSGGGGYASAAAARGDAVVASAAAAAEGAIRAALRRDPSSAGSPTGAPQSARGAAAVAPVPSYGGGGAAPPAHAPVPSRPSQPPPSAPSRPPVVGSGKGLVQVLEDNAGTLPIVSRVVANVASFLSTHDVGLVLALCGSTFAAVCADELAGRVTGQAVVSSVAGSLPTDLCPAVELHEPAPVTSFASLVGKFAPRPASYPSAPRVAFARANFVPSLPRVTDPPAPKSLFAAVSVPLVPRPVGDVPGRTAAVTVVSVGGANAPHLAAAARSAAAHQEAMTGSQIGIPVIILPAGVVPPPPSEGAPQGAGQQNAPPPGPPTSSFTTPFVLMGAQTGRTDPRSPCRHTRGSADGGAPPLQVLTSAFSHPSLAMHIGVPHGALRVSSVVTTRVHIDAVFGSGCVHGVVFLSPVTVTLTVPPAVPPTTASAFGVVFRECVFAGGVSVQRPSAGVSPRVLFDSCTFSSPLAPVPPQEGQGGGAARCIAACGAALSVGGGAPTDSNVATLLSPSDSAPAAASGDAPRAAVTSPWSILGAAIDADSVCVTAARCTFVVGRIVSLPGESPLKGGCDVLRDKAAEEVHTMSRCAAEKDGFNDTSAAFTAVEHAQAVAAVADFTDRDTVDTIKASVWDYGGGVKIVPPPGGAAPPLVSVGGSSGALLLRCQLVPLAATAVAVGDLGAVGVVECSVVGPTTGVAVSGRGHARVLRSIFSAVGPGFGVGVGDAATAAVSDSYISVAGHATSAVAVASPGAAAAVTHCVIVRKDAPPATQPSDAPPPSSGAIDVRGGSLVVSTTFVIADADPTPPAQQGSGGKPPPTAPPTIAVMGARVVSLEKVAVIGAAGVGVMCVPPPSRAVEASIIGLKGCGILHSTGHGLVLATGRASVTVEGGIVFRSGQCGVVFEPGPIATSAPSKAGPQGGPPAPPPTAPVTSVQQVSMMDFTDAAVVGSYGGANISFSPTVPVKVAFNRVEVGAAKAAGLVLPRPNGWRDLGTVVVDNCNFHTNEGPHVVLTHAALPTSGDVRSDALGRTAHGSARFALQVSNSTLHNGKNVGLLVNGPPATRPEGAAQSKTQSKYASIYSPAVCDFAGYEAASNKIYDNAGCGVHVVGSGVGGHAPWVKDDTGTAALRFITSPAGSDASVMRVVEVVSDVDLEQWYGCVVRGNLVRGCGGGGMNLGVGAHVLVEKNQVMANPQFGILLSSLSTVAVVGCMVDSLRGGIIVASPPPVEGLPPCPPTPSQGIQCGPRVVAGAPFLYTNRVKRCVGYGMAIVGALRGTFVRNRFATSQSAAAVYAAVDVDVCPVSTPSASCETAFAGNAIDAEPEHPPGVCVGAVDQRPNASRSGVVQALVGLLHQCSCATTVDGASRPDTTACGCAGRVKAAMSQLAARPEAATADAVAQKLAVSSCLDAVDVVGVDAAACTACGARKILQGGLPTGFCSCQGEGFGEVMPGARVVRWAAV